MHLILFAWLYIALMLSLTQWPNVLAMTGLFLLLGIVPGMLLLHGLRGRTLSETRAAQRARRDAALVKQTVGRGDDGDADENED
jgi:hypothetical protein